MKIKQSSSEKKMEQLQHILKAKGTLLALMTLISFASSSLLLADISEVSTDSGIYGGHESEHAAGVTVFNGIGFAAPPVRDLRWKPPARAIPHAGVRQADRVGPACWQARNSDASLYARGNLRRSEDCLYLNVFSNAEGSADSLPVLVWFHGGSNTAGHGGAKIFDGSNLAARGAVVVTANYRLGPMGFMAHAALTAESENNSSGNYGVLDQLEVLNWVQTNIANFGGDPDRVTIFGQSAGGTDVCLLMSSPLSEGKIHGVIGQSPGCIKSTRTLADGNNSGHAAGERYARELGITGSGASALEQLRDISPQQLISTPSGNGPVIDGWLIPNAPYDLLESGRQNRIPVMVGGLAEENHGLQSGSAEISEAELDEYLSRVFGDDAGRLKAMYQQELEISPLDARKYISTDNGFLLSSRMWGRLVEERGNDAYVYFFNKKPPVFRLYVPANPDLNSDGGQRSLGAYHSGELAYVFDNLDLVGLGWDEEDRELSETMADYWVNFARSGNPNGEGLPHWPAYDAQADLVQILDSEVRAAVHPRKERLDALEEIFLRSR
jgi:para-nitrobenzyl esterase